MILKFRKSVTVSSGPDLVVLQNPSFKMDLPSSWVESIPCMEQLSDKKITINEGETDLQFLNVIEALRRMGFIAFEEKASFQLRECRAIFDSLVEEWYAEYYTHPLWEKARTGKLSNTGLLAWLIHNYHISIAAGITDARAAITMPTQQLRSFFRENCLEEYWHCDAFYFVRHPNLNISDEYIKNYVPLPSSAAFMQQAIRTAETDWVANVLISYFQESSIRFYEDCIVFYESVEKAYNIPGMFKSWLQHMSLDFEHSHADVLGELLDNELIISKTQLLSSFQSAYMAFRYLIGALDEILIEDEKQEAVYLRNPISNGVIDPRNNTLLSSYKLPKSITISESNPIDLYTKFSHVLSFSEIARVTVNYEEKESAYLADRLASSFFKALSFSKAHEEVILFGKLANSYVTVTGDHEERSLETYSMSTLAMANFMHELAGKPRLFAFVLKHICELAKSNYEIQSSATLLNWLPVTVTGMKKLDNFLTLCSFSLLEIDEACTSILQLNELITRKTYYDSREFQLFPFG